MQPGKYVVDVDLDSPLCPPDIQQGIEVEVSAWAPRCVRVRFKELLIDDAVEGISLIQEGHDLFSGGVESIKHEDGDTIAVLDSRNPGRYKRR